MLITETNYMDGIGAYLFGPIVLLAIAACAALAFRRMWSLEDLPDLRRLDDAPEEKYAGMVRLFSPRDLDFLRSQPAFTPLIESDFRRRRAEVFHLYLRSMQRDFKTIHAAARMMTAQGVGGPDLSAQLLTLPFVFRRTLLVARWRVFLFKHGWASPSISISPAVEAMFLLRGQINLAAVASAA